MRVAVTYENGKIFQHFGHTEEFKVYDIEDGKIIIERSRPAQRKNIVELFEGFNGKYEHVDFVWDDSEGREAW